MRDTKTLIPLGFVLLLSACGPFESLNPLYTQRDLVQDPALVGAWIGGDKDAMTLKFQTSKEQSYELIETVTDDDTGEKTQIKYDAHLLQLGDIDFLDLLLEEIPLDLRRQAFQLRLVRSEVQNPAPIRFDPHLLKIDGLLYLGVTPAERTTEAIASAYASGKASPDGDAYEVRLIPAHWFFKISIDGDALRLAYIDQDWLNRMTSEEKASVGYEDVGDGVLTGPTENLQDFVLKHDDEEAFSKDNALEFRRVK